MKKMEARVITLNKHKIYVVKDFCIFPNLKKEICNLIEKEYFLFLDHPTSKLNFNFVASELCFDYFNSLYYKFVYECLKIFGPFN